MSETGIFLLILIGWFALVKFVFPRLGIKG
jgi:hypothetical protein